MRVIELNCDHVWESRPSLLRLLESANNVEERCSAPEVLLL